MDDTVGRTVVSRGIGLIAVVVAMTACTSSDDAERAGIELELCDLGTVTALCGTYPVYEDRAAASGPVIDLHVAVYPARGGESRPDPIVFLSGGPGGAATEDGPHSLGILRAANRHRDIVMVDQRGTGGSNPLDCPRPVDPNRWHETDELAACLADLPGDSRRYTTAWGVDDVDEVVSALGYNEVNLFGGSYGATMAQVYLQRHPERVRTALLLAGTDLDVPLFELRPLSSQRVLDALFARCAADAECRAAYPDPAADLAAVIARLDREPVEVTVPTPNGTTSFLLSAEVFREVVDWQLTGTSAAGALPRLLHSASEDDWDDMVEQAFWLSDALEPSWPAMSLTIFCHEPWARLRSIHAESYARGSYLSVDTLAPWAPSVCAVVPPPPDEAMYEPSTPVEVPVLAINGALDPADPPEFVASLGRVYPDSRVLTAPGQAHWGIGAQAESCFGAIYADLVDQARVDNLEASCLDELGAPPFNIR